MAATAKARDFKGSLRRLLQFLHPHLWKLGMVVLLNLVGAVCSSLGPKVMGLATNEIARGSLALL